MKIRTLILTLLSVILTEGIVQAEDKPAQELSNTRYAEVELRITTDPQTFPMGTDEDNVQRLKDVMFSPEVLGTAWKEIIGTSAHINISVIETPRDIGGLQTARVKVVVALWSEEKPAAEELLETYIEKLKGELSKEYDFAQSLFVDKHRQYAQRTNYAENRLRDLQRQQNKLPGGTLDKESVRQRILEHEKAKIENSMQQAILQKREEGLLQQIDDMESETSMMIEKDEIINELERLLVEQKGILEKTLKMMEAAREQKRNHPGTFGIKSEINQTKMHLAERKQQLRNEMGEGISELNRQLRETTMQLEELNLQEAVLAGYSPGNISDSIEYEMLEVQIQAAKENLRRALIEMRGFQLQIDLLQSPTVSYDKIVSYEEVPK
jgi:hypothetical protein